MEILPWTPLQTPSTSDKRSSLTATPMMLKIGKNLLHFLHKNCFKFDTNPTVDLGGTTTWNKAPEALSWNSFHAYFLHTFFLWTTFPHIRINLFLTHSLSSFSLFPTKDIPLFLGKPPWPFLELVPLVQWKLRNPSLQSMAPSSFKSQWELKKICPPIDFRMRIFGPNETQKIFHLSNQIGWQSSWLMGLEDSSFPLLWISWWGSWAWSLSFSFVDPHILFLHPNYFK